MFPGNCYTDFGENSSRIFHYIAQSGDMIAKAEPLLFPGKMPQSQVAFLFPRSSFAWDQQDTALNTCPGTGGTEDPHNLAMDYSAVLAGALPVPAAIVQPTTMTSSRDV